MKNKTSKEHYEKYAAFYAVDPEAFDGMAREILEGLTDGDPLEYLRISYENDPHLNNTFTRRVVGRYPNYDRYFPITQHIMHGHLPDGRSGLSLAENTCILKHAMIYHLLKCVPEYKE